MFTLPNLQSAPTFDAQAIDDSTDFAILAAGIGGTGVLTGCQVVASSPVARTVDIGAGSVKIKGTEVPVAAVTALAVSAASASDRKDLVVVDQSGTVSIVVGTPCGTAGWSRATANPISNPPPSKPAIPANTCVLAELYVASISTTIPAANIIDKGVAL